MLNIKKLPTSVIAEIENVLKGYDTVNVSFSDNKYNVFVGSVVTTNISSDYKFIGTYEKDDVFNDDDNIINYVVEFHSFPCEYNGKKDYASLTLLSHTNNDYIAIMDNHNIVIVKNTQN